MTKDDLTSDDRLALRAFDLFCSAGRPQRPQGDVDDPQLEEVSREELFDAFLTQHPSFSACRKSILTRLPERVRVHATWWKATQKAA
jgi:hypothetical protein